VLLVVPYVVLARRAFVGSAPTAVCIAMGGVPPAAARLLWAWGGDAVWSLLHSEVASLCAGALSAVCAAAVCSRTLARGPP
ncbi:unnamed protein product, partial [Prorocentrum cordatum]